MHSTRLLARPALRGWRHVSQFRVLGQSAEPQAAAPAKLDIPPPTGVDRPASAKIEKLVAEISQLNLLEVSELSGLLKKRLNLPDAPAFPVGGFVQAAGAPAEDEEEAPPKAVKTTFDVKLVKFDEKKKMALIQKVRSLMEGMNVLKAKKFVEGIPSLIKAEVPKEEAERLKEIIEQVGGTVEIE